ncbi:MAG: outer membrane lipoprotein-sorting protein [Bacteroidetes bacterium GWF2_49_14]|nr:MAG: outer membrane lipoprotein-sorting protein [Bacteroidetes bacterium GWF2_49_14]HBB91418.1 outer membrane lipoprotein-sorting protein [Bacteroidales bacterium]
MKSIIYSALTIFFLLSLLPSYSQESLTARQIIDKADKNMQGESSISTMTMTVRRPTWERTIGFKNWGKGHDLALTLVTEPAREKGQTFLKRGNDMWNYIPSIGRLIKLPPSMMSQGWMGSDYTNDDILNESSMVLDYNQELLGTEEFGGFQCYKISLVPLEESNIVWGKIITWVSQVDVLFLKSEYYDENQSLVRTETAGDIKIMDGRKIPTRIEILPADEPQNQTIVTIQSIDFDVKLDDNFFSQQNMKSVK